MAFTTEQVVTMCRKASAPMTKGLSDEQVYELDQAVGKLRAFKALAKQSAKIGSHLVYDSKAKKYSIKLTKSGKVEGKGLTLSEARKILDKVEKGIDKAIADKEKAKSKPDLKTIAAKAPAKKKTTGKVKKPAAKKAPAKKAPKAPTTAAAKKTRKK